MFKRIWAEIERIWAHQERTQTLNEERLVVMQDRQDVLEGRIRAVDRWMMEIGSVIGTGVPLEGLEKDTDIQGFDPESELDVENDDLEDTLIGMAWGHISGESEGEQ